MNICVFPIFLRPNTRKSNKKNIPNNDVQTIAQFYGERLIFNSVQRFAFILVDYLQVKSGKYALFVNELTV